MSEVNQICKFQKKIINLIEADNNIENENTIAQYTKQPAQTRAIKNIKNVINKSQSAKKFSAVDILTKEVREMNDINKTNSKKILNTSKKPVDKNCVKLFSK